MAKLSLEPTKRTLLNGKVAVFYSPQQIEAIIPVEKRLTKSACSSLTPNFSGHKNKHQQQAED
jgi:hypothetical protein